MKRELRLNIRITEAIKEKAQRAADADYNGNVSAYIKALIEQDAGKREALKRRT